MKKRVLSCLLAIALLCALVFSAGAVCARSFAADVVLPPDADVFTSSESLTDVPEDPTVVLYDSAQTPTTYALPDVEVKPEKDGSVVKSVLVCVVIGLVIALIVTLSVKSSYKPVRRKSDAADYLVDGSLRVTASEETFSRSERSERTIEHKNTTE